eukprot:m.138736 g.138736  ORF g.138736 m.138736 type:complete len:583 (-) comp16562_c0_seq1:193-1941(-)
MNIFLFRLSDTIFGMGCGTSSMVAIDVHKSKCLMNEQRRSNMMMIASNVNGCCDVDEFGIIDDDPILVTREDPNAIALPALAITNKPPPEAQVHNTTTCETNTGKPTTTNTRRSLRISVRMTKRHIDVLTVADSIGDVLEKRINLIAIFGGPNSNKGLIIHHLHRVLGIECISIQDVILEFLRSKMAIEKPTLSDIVEYASAGLADIDMRTALSLLADKIREKHMEILARNKEVAIHVDTPQRHAPLLIVDLIPNLRFLHKTDVFKNGAVKIFGQFNRKEFQFRLAIVAQGRVLTPRMKKGRSSSSSSRTPVPASSPTSSSKTVEKEDEERLQKRSVMHSNTSFPFVRFFEDLSQTVHVNTGMLDTNDFLLPLTEWIAQYYGEGKMFPPTSATPKTMSMAFSANKLQNKSSVPSSDAFPKVCNIIIGEGAQLQSFCTKLFFVGGKEIAFEPHVVNSIEEVHQCVHQVETTSDKNTCVIELNSSKLPDSLKHKRRLRCPRTSTLCVGSKKIVASSATHLHIYELGMPSLNHSNSFNVTYVVILLPSVWLCEVAIVEALETRLHKKASMTLISRHVSPTLETSM